VPHRGKRNEPAYVADTARFIAKIREIGIEQLEAETCSNYSRLFSLEDN
jgi:TatD DNase family protein